MDLNGKAALVTGGASGIGAALVRRMAAAGAVVGIVDQDEPAARALAEEVGGLALLGDVTDPDRMSYVLDIAEDTFGRLNAVFLNAGTTSGQAAVGLEPFDVFAYRRFMGVNVEHVVTGLCSAVPALRRAGGGIVVVTASLAGLVPSPADPLYTLSKHAVVGYVRAAAVPLAAEGITVCAVCPGYTDTPLIEPIRESLLDFPLLSADDVVDAMEAIIERGQPGEAWFVQPGKQSAPYEFRGVPGPAGSMTPPVLSRQDS